MDKKNYIKRTDSRDAVKLFTWNQDQATVFPDFSMDAALSLINSDPVARGAFRHFIDKFMEGDYAIVVRDSLKYDREFELRLDREFKFRQEYIRKVATMGKVFVNVFVELLRNTDGSIKALNIVDSSNIDPVTKPNGDPIKFLGKTEDPTTGKRPSWTADEMLWIKFDDRSTGFSPIDLRTLYETLKTKEYITQYVAWLWKTGQYRLIYNFKSASNTDIDNFLAFAQKHDRDFRVPFVAKGELETSILRDMKEQDSLINYLKYLDGQTLIAMRIPPIDAGIPDASGRSNADAQSNNLDTHITSFKKVLEDFTNDVLFPKMNKGNSMLRFAPNDRFAVKMALENVKMMKDMMMTEDVIREYMMDVGLFFGTEKLFEDPILPEVGGPGGPQKQSDNAPSRQRKGSGMPNQKVGTGSQGTSRPDQVGGQ